MIDVKPAVRLILVTGGPGAGKTTLCKRLYGFLPKNWRFVPLDNFIELALRTPGSGDWPDKTVRYGEVCLDYWRKEKRYNLLVEGVVQIADQVSRLCAAFGTAWPSESVRLIQLTRTLATHKLRRASDAEWDPPMISGMTKDDAFLGLEARVPPAVPGARIIPTDEVTEEEVFQAVLRELV
jgi:energy-coupling factor transporter ATP-binding protein EcfA2